MQREILYLRDIVRAADSIEQFLRGVDRDVFLNSDLLQSAVLHKMAIIGEAVACLPKALCETHHDVPWRNITRFRNIVVHAYFGISWERVWDLALKEVPILKRQIQTILATDYGQT